MAKKSPSTNPFLLLDESLEEELCAKLDAVDRALHSLHSEIPLVSHIASYMLEQRGKRLRPLLVLLSAKACGYEGDDDVSLACFVEWIHAATLLHDDVLDEAALRRGQPTVRQIWGNRLSVRMEDYVYFRAICVSAQSPSLMRAWTALLHACERMVLGELMQLAEQTADPTMAEAVYLRIVEYKTAALIAATFQAGGILADSSAGVCDTLYECGVSFGIGFQLKDDALDYLEGANSGKRSGQDLRHGVITLPLLHLLSQCDERESAKLRTILRTKTCSDSALQWIQTLLLHYGSIDYTFARVQRYGALAKQHLSSILPHSPYKQAMITLVDKVLQEEGLQP